MPFEIKTERLKLKELSLDDAPFIHELLNSPEWLAHIGDRNIKTLDDARRYLKGPIDSYATHGYGLWRVGLRDNDEPIGICGIIRRISLEGPDLGFALLPGHVGKGYGFEASAGCLRFANDHLGINRLLAITTPSNARSIKLLQTLGFAHEEDLLLPGEVQEVMLFAKELDGAGAESLG